MKNKLKGMKGITLIALVITIIVLLILAGVSIATLTGENGLLTQAQESKTASKKAEAEEMFKLIANEWQIEKRKTNPQSLGDFLTSKIPEELDEVKGEGPFTIVYNGYQIVIDSDGKLVGEVEQKIVKPTFAFNPETLEIGEAINPENYGKKVTNYNVKTEETGCWRLFYQDNTYTYLISDNCIGEYCPSNYFSSYKNGTYVSTVGQRLNKMLLEKGTFFNSNSNSNIRTTAWLTDTEADIWKQYKNEDAVFAIGSSTVELYKASFNATASANGATTFTLSVRTYGYDDSTESGQLQTLYSNGIYNNASSHWLASPGGHPDGADDMQMCLTSNGIISSAIVYDDMTLLPVRPVVCIPTSVFNSDYASSLE